MAKKIGFDLSMEAKSQIKIISGQGNISEDEAVEKAVFLLYSVLPEDKNARISLDDFIADTVLELGSKTSDNQE